MSAVQSETKQQASQPLFLNTTKYMCKLCDFESNWESSVSHHHQATHVGTRYRCQDCGKKFKMKGSLTKHQHSLHLSVNYPCNKCNFQAPDKSNLSKHRKSAHMRRTYFCQDFGHPFKHNPHQRSVHEGTNYPCNQCDYKANTKVNMAIHLDSVHIVRKYPCQICGQQLPTHQKSKHISVKLPCEQKDYQVTERSCLKQDMKKTSKFATHGYRSLWRIAEALIKYTKSTTNIDIYN